MEITIKIADKAIREAITYHVESLLEEFSSEAIEAAGVPKTHILVKDLMSDAKFMQKVQKDIAAMAKSFLEDDMCVEDLCVDVCDAQLNSLYNNVNKVQLKLDKANAKSDEDKQIANSVSFLAQRGYKVTK